jgi:hypothetical protein
MLLKNLVLSLAVAGAALVPLMYGAPAQAQATRTWISGVGDDANPCSRTAPCKTFAGAISKTAVDGQIDCLDPGGFGALTITKSITIDCHEVFGSILVSGTPGIVIATDSAPNVRIRNMSFTGLGTGTVGIRIIGGTASTKVYIQDCWIDDFSSRGISDERTNGGSLFVGNTQIQNMVGAAIGIAGGSAVQVSLDNVRALGSGFGVALATNSKVTITRSVLAGNTTGLETEGSSFTFVDNTVISGNGLGIQVVGGTVQLANTDVVNNTTQASGTVNSYTNSRFFNNGAGGTITATGSVTNPTGQQ